MRALLSEYPMIFVMDNVFTNCFDKVFLTPDSQFSNPMRSFSLSRASLLPLPVIAFTALVGSLASTTHAQYGVSPSQTGMFFDDLRGKADSRNKKDQVQQGEGVYDYSDQAGYQGGAEGGADGNSVMHDASRQIAQGYNSNGTFVYSQRQSGDYTQYSGPYQSSSTFFAPTYTSDPFLGGRRNLKLGPVNVGFGLTGLVEFNDNINRSHDNPVSDTIASAYLNISANYQLTQKSTLSLSTAIGFDHYFDHPELSPYGKDGMVVNVLPGSTIAIDGTIGPVYVVLYDRMSMRPAMQNDFTISSSNIFGVFQNDAGLGANWAINSKTSLSVNYAHSNAIGLGQDYENDDLNSPTDVGRYDRSIDSIQASLSWTPNGVFTVGLEGGASYVSYPQQYNNDGVMSNIGAFFATPLGKSTSLRVGGGIQSFSFDAPPAFSGSLDDDAKRVASANARVTDINGQIAETNADATLTPAEKTAKVRSLNKQLAAANQGVTDAVDSQTSRTAEYNSNNRDTSGLSDFYYNVTLSNRLNARISQALNFGHESALNATSNSITADYISYGMGIVAWSGSRVMLSTYYESAKESGGLEAEDIDQWGFDAYISHQLTTRLRFGVGYHYGVSDSNLEGRNYKQNAFNVDVNYALTRKMNVTAGYRFLTTSAEDSLFDFDQNRFVFSANYNF